jgi:catechol 2,3-dioxygenase-like lactoylglutathione lyase family enzyme
MNSTISKLLATYEYGKLSRRDLVQGLALLAASPGTMSAAGFQGNSITHVSLYVSDLQRSSDFYQHVLGCTVNKRGVEYLVRFGKNFLVLRSGKPAGTVDHIAIGVENFNKESVTADLKARGATPMEGGRPGPGFHVVDPDGFQVQIVSINNSGSGEGR